MGTFPETPACRGSLLALSSGFAHSIQNFAPGEFSVAQEGHLRVNGDAHSSQNFALSGLSAPHFTQRMAVTRSPSLASRSRLNSFQGASQRLDFE
jgi:hypothetical protein